MSPDGVLDGFKMTEIGAIPEDWKVVKLADAAILNRESRNPSEVCPGAHFEYIDIAGVEAGRIAEARTILGKDAPSRARRVIHENDILFSTVRPYLKSVAIAQEKHEGGICSTGFAVITTKKNALPNYLFYVLLTREFMRQLMEVMRGANYPAVNPKHIRDAYIPLPPILEQRAIAHSLSTIQEAKEKTEATISALKELKKSMMKHLFKYGLVSLADSSGVVRKVTEVGEFPAHWQVFDLSELVDIFDNRRIPVREDERARQKKVYPYCGANGIIDYVEDYLFEGEHLLFAEDGGDWGPFAQSSYIMDGRFWVNNHAHILRAREKMTTNLYLMHALNYLDLTSLVTGDARGKINQATLKHIRIPLPPLNEQRRIILMLETVTQAVKTEENRTDSLTKIFNTLLDSLMTGKLRVNNLEVPT